MYETIEEALARLGLTKEDVWNKLLRLQALHHEAVRLIEDADNSTVDGYDYGYLARMGYSWVLYRGRCYPVKSGSPRYLNCLRSAKRLQDIEAQIKQIDGTYDTETGCISITRKRLETTWTDQAGSQHRLISI